jgi:hypothetical protein
LRRLEDEGADAAADDLTHERCLRYRMVSCSSWSDLNQITTASHHGKFHALRTDGARFRSLRRSSHYSLKRVCTTVPLYELVTTTEGSCKSVRVVNLPSDDQTMRAPQDSPVKAARVRRVRVMPGPVRLCQLLLRSGQVRYYITRPKSRTMSVTRQLMLPPSIFT